MHKRHNHRSFLLHAVRIAFDRMIVCVAELENLSLEFLDPIGYEEVRNDIEKKYGIPIVNKRVSVTPVSLIGGNCSPDGYFKIAKTLDRAAKTLGINFDPSHLQWQGVNPAIFLRDFADRIYHVHMKDVKVNKDDHAGILGSHIDFGDTRRGWNFVSLGHGDVDFDGICRELNQGGYNGPISIEWEDSGMDRVYGATEACEFIKKYNFDPSTIAFDSAIKTE